MLRISNIRIGTKLTVLSGPSILLAGGTILSQTSGIVADSEWKDY